MVCASSRPIYQLNVYMAIDPLVTFMSRVNFMHGLVEHVKVLYTRDQIPCVIRLILGIPQDYSIKIDHHGNRDCFPNQKSEKIINNVL